MSALDLSSLRSFSFAFVIFISSVNCDVIRTQSNVKSLKEQLQHSIGHLTHPTQYSSSIREIRHQLKRQPLYSLAGLTGEEINTVVDVKVSSHGQMLTRLSDHTTLNVRDSEHWLKTIESKFSLENKSPTVRSLRCMRANQDAFLRFDDGPWQKIGRDAGRVDHTCLQTDTWIRDLVNGFDDQIALEISDDSQSSPWVKVRLSGHILDSQPDVPRMPSNLDTWDILRDEDDRYAYSILARYGQVTQTSGYFTINVRSGVIGQSSINTKVLLDGPKKLIVSLSINRERKSGNFDFVVPPHIEIKPRISLEDTLQRWRKLHTQSNSASPNLQPRDKRKTLQKPKGQ